MQVCTTVWGKTALQDVDDGNEDVADAAVLQFVHHATLELGDFGLLDPDTQDILVAVG